MQQQIIEEIAKHLGISPQDIDPYSALSDDLGLSPVDTADLLSDLANKFKVTFDPQEIERLKTVNDLVETIEDLSLE